MQKCMAISAARAEVLAFQAQFEAAFPEREQIVRSLVLALIARTNLIMYGPPGTGKSLLARTLAKAMTAQFFDILMTRYTTPSELWGSVDVAALKAGKQKRVLKNYMAEAVVAFLDEGFKANSACLNSLLTAVNEHMFHDDGQLIQLPLRTAVLASNEFPEDSDNLGAFDDRFLFRFQVDPFKNPDNFKAMLQRMLPPVTAKISMEAIEALDMEARSITVNDDAIDALWSMKEDMSKKSIYVSDRKFDGACRILRADAALKGAPEVTTAHMPVLEHILWLRPDQQPAVREIVRSYCAKWTQAIADAEMAIDQQDAEMAKACGGNVPQELALSTIPMIGSKLTQMKDVLDRVEVDHPGETNGEVVRLNIRIDQIKARGKEAVMRLM